MYTDDNARAIVLSSPVGSKQVKLCSKQVKLCSKQVKLLTSIVSKQVKLCSKQVKLVTSIVRKQVKLRRKQVKLLTSIVLSSPVGKVSHTSISPDPICLKMTCIESIVLSSHSYASKASSKQVKLVVHTCT